MLIHEFNKNDALTELFKEYCYYVGLHDFKIDVVTSAEKPELIVRFTKFIDFLDISLLNTSQLMDKILKPVINSVKESGAVKDALFDLEENIKFLKEQVQNQDKEINRLKEFEVYYNMKYNLNHGKKDV